MKLVYFTHSKENKNRHCNAIIGVEGGPYHTIHLTSKQKDKKSVEFKPAFSGYELGMDKKPMIDKFLSFQYISFLQKKEVSDEKPV